MDVQAVARELGVRYILEGSVRKAGNRIRVTDQLIDGANGQQLWAERYDRDFQDIFDLQDEITETVVGAIEPEVAQAELDRTKAKRSENLDAWDLCLRARAQVYLFTQEAV
jgi:adenylate cyclase